jgi:putative endonuclease
MTRNEPERSHPRRRAAERRGRRSETIAALFLMLKGYRIVGRRVRTHVGEIDLIARAPCGILCFVEVKARTTLRQAVESVGRRQQARIARAARLWLAGRPGLGERGVRFDAIALVRGRLPRHFRDAWRDENS